MGLKLQDEIIPEFFIQLEEMEDCPKNSEELVGSFHSRGINMRYLGRITTEISHNFIKELAVREILASALTVLIRDGLSFLTEEANGFSVEDVKKCILHYLNEVLSQVERPSSKKVWEFLTDLIRKKYGITIERDIIENINLPGFLISVCGY